MFDTAITENQAIFIPEKRISSSGKIMTTYPATRELHRKPITDTNSKRRVAGYARVSTDHEEQITSYEAQVEYYTDYISSRADWTLVSVYTDEGISATSTAKREGFKKMVSDALNGHIDLIVTKSISRFARNTVDSLTTVRQLKEKGCEVFFERENIYTFDSKGELLITLLSSLAQEESRSLSENVTWGQRKRMQDGKYIVANKQFLGYEKDENGQPRIIESEAKTVRLIYSMFLKGKTPSAIAKYLTDKGVPTPAKKEKWSVSTVLSILTNVKYKGDALLQRTLTVDFLTKKSKINEGEVPQYYIEEGHPAIIEPEIFDLVQVELQRRKENGLRHSGQNPFSAKIICGECGNFYGSKIWHSTSKYRRIIWRCNNKYKSGGKTDNIQVGNLQYNKCQAPHLSETAVQNAFIEAFNRLHADRERLREDYAVIIETLSDISALDKEQGVLIAETAKIAEAMRKDMEENACRPLDQSEFKARRDALSLRYDAANKRIKDISDEKRKRTVKQESILQFLTEIEERGVLTEFDEGLWVGTVENMAVGLEGGVVVAFRDGSEVMVGLGGK